MYTYSAEVRWFFQGRLSDEHPLVDWFSKPLTGYGRKPEDLLVFEAEKPASQGAGTGHSRIDAYLILRGAETVGTKLRGGDADTRLEVKAEASAPTSWHLQNGVSGRTDSWVKWSFKHNTLNSALEPMQRAGEWVRIGKERWLRKINADGKEPTFVVANAKAYKDDHVDTALRKLPDCGCNAELTRIFVDDDHRDIKKAWYTIGLEAFGPNLSHTPDILNAGARLLFRELGVPTGLELSERNSLSYPRWFGALSVRN